MRQEERSRDEARVQESAMGPEESRWDEAGGKEAEMIQKGRRRV